MPEEIKKSQIVRLWDVFFLGPAMMYIGWSGKLKPWEKALLISAGALTIYYNGGNYLRNRKQFEDAGKQKLTS